MPDRSVFVTALLDDAERALTAAWDPSIHVQEAVRASADLDRVRNLIGERLGSWVSHDNPELDPGDHDRAARAAAEGTPRPGLGPTDPGLLEARRRLGELYRAVADARHALEEAVRASSPVQTPNLTALLGPELAARLVAQAGGLERLARLPSSTVQVLGAERAFFEHLRGRAPPPRHGLLFLHPAIQSAPRAERGKLARALAGKVAIAARLDHEGAAVNPSLGAAFEARRAQVRARRGRTAPAPGTGSAGVKPST
jgi:nucleolar protein 56